jgi:hypothetical protein
MTWDFDITAAPCGKTVHSERKVGDRIHQISDFVPDYIWAATGCGKVIKSYWIPPVGKNAGRWSGFANGEQPIAWQHFVVPEHPSVESKVRRGASSLAPGELKKMIAEGRAFVDTNPEARFIEDGENACPHCGGSGHKDDVRAA